MIRCYLDPWEDRPLQWPEWRIYPTVTYSSKLVSLPVFSFCCCLYETGVHVVGLELSMWFRMSLNSWSFASIWQALGLEAYITTPNLYGVVDQTQGFGMLTKYSINWATSQVWDGSCLFLFSFNIWFIYLCVHTYVYMCISHGTCVEVKGWFSGIESLLPTCTCQDLPSNHWAWQRVPFPAEPAAQPVVTYSYTCIYKNAYVPGTVLGIGHGSVKKSGKKPALVQLVF